jgi:hypothetical protein
MPSVSFPRSVGFPGEALRRQAPGNSWSRLYFSCFLFRKAPIRFCRVPITTHASTPKIAARMIQSVMSMFVKSMGHPLVYSNLSDSVDSQRGPLGSAVRKGRRNLFPGRRNGSRAAQIVPESPGNHRPTTETAAAAWEGVIETPFLIFLWYYSTFRITIQPDSACEACRKR